MLIKWNIWRNTLACIWSICLRRRHRRQKQQTGSAAGRDQTTLNETELKDTAAGAGATSDKTKVNKVAASVGPRSTPAPLVHSYGNVRETVAYEEVM